MPNRLTRVPDEPPPEIGDHPVLIGMADLFMLLMVSRPKSGSLARTWVTPSTRWLTAGAAFVLALAAALAVSGGMAQRNAVSVILGAALLLLAASSAAVTRVSLLQQRAHRRRVG
jgi:hypothetical protein